MVTPSGTPKLNPEALRAIRLKDGYSVAKLAQVLCITPSHLSNIEAGRRGAAPEVIKRMAETLCVPISALMWYEPEAGSK